MKTLKPNSSSRLILTAAAAMVLTTAAAVADRAVQRIDHPNGRPTFTTKPRNHTPTVGVYSNGQGLSVENDGQRKLAGDRISRIQLGRGQYIPVPRYSR